MPDTNTVSEPLNETPAAQPSVLVTIRKDWESAGAKMPDAKAAAALKKAFADAKIAKEAAERALTDANAKYDAAVLAVAKSCGAQSPLTLNGQVYHLSARGQRVFLKTFAEKAPVVF